MIELYLNLCKVLSAIGFHVDRWRDQDGQMEEEHSFPLPAVFVQFGEVAWRGVGELSKTGVASLTLHVMHEDFQDQFQGSEQQEDSVTKTLQVVDTVWAATEGLKGVNHGPLNNITTVYDQAPSSLIHDQLVYQVDITKTKPSKYVRPTIEPDILIEKNNG